MNKIQSAFEDVKATEKLKTSTIAYLESERQRRQTPRRAWIQALETACAALLLILCLGGIYKVNITPVSYISIDVNPSIELSLNRFNRIVSATAYNDDGKLILKRLSLKGKPYTKAVDLVLENEEMKAFLTDTAELTFTVAAKSVDTEQAILAGLETCPGYQNHHGQSYCADSESIQEAHNCGMSFGKYNAYRTLTQYDSSVTLEECHDMTMAEIHSRIRDCEGNGCGSNSSTENSDHDENETNEHENGHGYKHRHHQ